MIWKHFSFLFIGCLSLLHLSAQQTHVIEVAAGEEVLTQLMVSPGDQLSFQVTGEWSMFAGWEMVDFQGHTNYKKINEVGFLGALGGRIEGGESFLVEDGKSHTSKSKGRLILFTNVGNYTGLAPKGSMQVVISGVKPISKDEFESMDWDMEMINTVSEESYMSESERDVFLLINKARVQPQNFAEMYLKNRVTDSEDSYNLYVEMVQMQPMLPLEPSRLLYADASNELAMMSMNGATDVENEEYSACISLGEYKPLEIVLSLLIDKGSENKLNRANLLNEAYPKMGLSLGGHSEYDYGCVIFFGKE